VKQKAILIGYDLLDPHFVSFFYKNILNFWEVLCVVDKDALPTNGNRHDNDSSNIILFLQNRQNNWKQFSLKQLILMYYVLEVQIKQL